MGDKSFSQADRAVLSKAVTAAYQRGFYKPDDIADLSHEGIKNLAQMYAQEILDMAILSLPIGAQIAAKVALTLDPKLKMNAFNACKCIKGDAQIRRIRLTPRDIN